ncbi:MAG: RrF2 family transcriptional regulator [Oscillospiraceae bacterium]|nr:RrF2 family transcriptional regulator [Oscillospiraceae bacterium]
MMVSTRGRYALRVMLDLAEHYGQGYVPMKEVAERQELSLKYMERIMPDLTRSGCVEGVHGKGGGYRLRRPPQDITVWEILSQTEGDLAPVSCLNSDAVACDRAAECRTLPLWQDFYKLTRQYFEGVTLSDLMGVPAADNYVI